jgi:TRAP-type C4-dicarboxylate transport system permease small subunit
MGLSDRLAGGVRDAGATGLVRGTVAGILFGVLSLALGSGVLAGFSIALFVAADVLVATVILSAYQVELVPAAVRATLPRPFAVARAIDRFIQYHEVVACLIALAVMILLAFIQVILRQLNGTDFAAALPFVPAPVGWFDLVSRQLVVWVGLLGASLATSEGRHISIEALPKILSARGKRRVDVFVNLASLAVTALLLGICMIWLSRSQMPKESALFVIEAFDLKVYGWPFLAVVPLGLGLMAWRFLTRAVEGVVLDDGVYTALRKFEEGEDMAALDATQEDEGVSLLLDTAEKLAHESGESFNLDQDTARAEVREVLQSGKHDSLSTQLRQAEMAQSATQPPKSTMKSTDEIATYHPQDLHDDQDTADPVLQHGDSSDELEISGIDDAAIEEVGDVDDALDAAADGARANESARDPSEVDEPPLPEGSSISLDSSDEVDVVSVSPDGATERVKVQLPENGATSEVGEVESNEEEPEASQPPADGAESDDS